MPTKRDTLTQMQRTVSRAARRRAQTAARVALWWSALPQPRPAFLTAWSLSVALDAPMQRVAPALRLLGWRRTYNRRDGVVTTLWLPPTQARTEPAHEHH